MANPIGWTEHKHIPQSRIAELEFELSRLREELRRQSVALAELLHAAQDMSNELDGTELDEEQDASLTVMRGAIDRGFKAVSPSPSSKHSEQGERCTCMWPVAVRGPNHSRECPMWRTVACLSVADPPCDHTPSLGVCTKCHQQIAPPSDYSYDAPHPEPGTAAHVAQQGAPEGWAAKGGGSALPGGHGPVEDRPVMLSELCEALRAEARWASGTGDAKLGNALADLANRLERKP